MRHIFRGACLLCAALFLTTSTSPAAAKDRLPRHHNPIVPGWYADPEGVVFPEHEHPYWVYPTLSLLYGQDTLTYAHDFVRKTDAINPDYNIQTHMDAFSSPDLKTWTKHPAVLSIENVSWLKYALWAPSVIRANGRYYIFFGGNDIQNEEQVGGIGVAVSDRPEGPFVDALGHPLITDHASQRETCIDRLRFDRKGFIKPVKMTK